MGFRSAGSGDGSGSLQTLSRMESRPKLRLSLRLSLLFLGRGSLPRPIFCGRCPKPPATIWASACPGPSSPRQTTDCKGDSAWHPSCIFGQWDVEDHASRLPGQHALCPGRQALRSLGGGTAAMLADGGFDTTFPHGDRRSERSGFRGRRRSGPAGGNAKGRSSPAGGLTSHTRPAAQGVRLKGRPERLCYG